MPVCRCQRTGRAVPHTAAFLLPHTARSVPRSGAARLSRSNGDGPGAPFHHALNRTIIAALAGAKQLSPNASPEPLHCRQGNTPQ